MNDTGNDGATGMSDSASGDGATYADGGGDEAAPEDAGGAADSPASPDSSDAATDAGANMCTTKICVDPVFDCPLQGCFNGCTNFLCN